MDKRELMLAYTRSGEKSLPPLVLLHGFLGDKKEWQPLMPVLSQHFYCICIDLPGHGESEALPQQISNSDMEQTLEPNGFTQCSSLIIKTLKRLDIEQFHLLGYSLGGRIALHLAQLAPKALLSLTLESAHPGLLTKQERQLRVQTDQTWTERLQQLEFKHFLSLWYQQAVFSDLSEPQRRQLITARSGNNADRLLALFQLTSLAKQQDLRHIPATLNCPCYYFVGELDGKFRQLITSWSQQTCSPQVITIADAGHNAHFSAPNTYCNQLVALLSKPTQGKQA